MSLLVVASFTVGCGSAPPPPPAELDTTLPLAMSTASAAPVVLPTPSAEPSASAAPATSAAPQAEAPAPKKTGRPPAIFSNDKKIQDTFGSAPAKLELGDAKARAVLKIPDGALDRGYNITFEIEAKVQRSAGQQVGRAYRLVTQVAGSESLSQVASTGDAFELALPAGGKKDANLAIGDAEIDSKGLEQVKWRVIPPSRIDDATNTAYFELPTLGANNVLHITTKPPSAGSAKGPK